MRKIEVTLTQVYRINGRLVVANSIEGAINTWREWNQPNCPDIRSIERMFNDSYQAVGEDALVCAEELVGEYHKDETEHIAYLEEQCAKSKVIIEQIDQENKNLRDDLKRISEGKLITVEQIKSVYAAAGICDQMHEKTDSDNLMALWATLKQWHKELTGGDELEG